MLKLSGKEYVLVEEVEAFFRSLDIEYDLEAIRGFVNRVQAKNIESLIKQS